MQLAAQAGGRILELGCGSGRALVPLASAGHRLVGLDRDLPSLTHLAGQLSEPLRSRVDLIACDFLRCPLADRFPLILMPCNTLSTVAPADHARLLSGVRALLASGGRFAASLPNPAVLAGLPERGETELEAVLFDPAGEDPLQVSSTWERQGQAVTVCWLYDRLKADGRVQRTEVRSTHHLFSADEWRDTFRSNGFHLEREYGDFDRTAYAPDSPHLIFIACPA